jgi:aerobic C4-dicarboxylate transport protein
VPVEGVAILLGVDRFMSEARAITNLIGNGAATLVIARSENAYTAPGEVDRGEGTAVLLRTPYDDASGPTFQPHE